MGTQYYAVNDEKKEAFNLDKGGWPLLVDSEYEGLSLLERVRKVFDYNDWWTEEALLKIAEGLKPYEPFRIITVNDTDDDKYKDYTITGSRFENDEYIGKNLFDPHDSY